MRIKPFQRQLGFVAIELMAILVILFFLAGIALPMIGNAKSKSASLLCLNNHKQVALAWQLYAQDNEGESANNYTIQSTQLAIQSNAFDNWANNIMTWSTGGGIPETSVTNELWVTKGTLHPFTDGDIDLYRCPSDRYLSPAQRQRGYTKRVRTMSMNGLVGRSEKNAPDTGRSWGFGGEYRQWLKARDIVNPAMTWLTIDEHPDSINDCFFINSLGSSVWGDIPATLHDRSSSFSFADGHAESRKWRSSRIRYPVTFRYPNVRAFDAEGRKDYAWYTERIGLVRY